MRSSTVIFFSIFSIAIIFASTHESRPHDTVQFDLGNLGSNNQLDFDFLDQHYKVQLRRNEDDNCHYYGHVLEPHQPDGSYLSLSLCVNRGIRGTITLPNNNERLLIFPSAVIDDPQYDEKVGIYNLTDPHMVYKERSKSFSPRSQSRGSKGGSRDLLASWWRNKVELYVLVDASWTYLFKSKYSSHQWYNQLESYVTELINGASGEYEWWNWDNVGSISVHMIHLEIMGEYSGRYARFKPRFVNSKFSNVDCSNKTKNFKS
eukprot:61261_1